MDIKQRRFDPQRDYNALAALMEAVLGEPKSAADLREEASRLPADGLRYRLVTEDAGSGLAGYGEVYRWPNTRAGKFYVAAATRPDARRQGIGGALLEHVEAWAREHAASLLAGEVRDDDRSSLDWAKRRGYGIRRHWWDSTLDLAAFDAARFAGVVDAVRSSGIRFFTLADAPGTATEQRLYELLSRTMVDIPGYEAEQFMSFATWRGWVIEGSKSWPEGVIIAADGERFVGVTITELEAGQAYTPHTSVDRAYRGRRIALTLKLLGIAAARRAGATFIRTGNDDQNAPMLAINRSLGFVPTAGGDEIAKELVT